MLYYMKNPQRNKVGDLIFVIVMILVIMIRPYLAAFFLVTVPVFIIVTKYLDNIKKDAHWIPVVLSPVPILLVLTYFIYGADDVRMELVDLLKQGLLAVMDNLNETNSTNEISFYLFSIKDKLDEVVLKYVLLTPGIMYAYMTVMFYVSQKIFHMKTNVKKYRYRVSDHLIWGLIAFGFLIVSKDIYINSVARNAVIIYLAIYFYQGVSVLSHFMEKLKVIPFLRVFIFFLIVIEPPVAIVVSLVGLFSIWINFYGKNDKEEKKTV